MTDIKVVGLEYESGAIALFQMMDAVDIEGIKAFNPTDVAVLEDARILCKDGTEGRYVLVRDCEDYGMFLSVLCNSFEQRITLEDDGGYLKVADVGIEQISAFFGMIDGGVE